MNEHDTSEISIASTFGDGPQTPDASHARIHDARPFPLPVLLMCLSYVPQYHKYLTCLSGPSFAKEVAQGKPTSVTVAAKDLSCAQKVQGIVSDLNFRIYTSDDVLGVEIFGAVKNVLAIACGASDGFDFGLNARAALITRGLAEISRMAVK